MCFYCPLILCSLTIWISSIVVGVISSFTILAVGYEIASKILLIIGVISLLTFCSIMTLLHVKKIRTLQNSLSVTDQSQRRMNVVVTLIISIFTIYQLSIIAGEIYVIYFFQHFVNYIYVECCIIFIGCLNYSCNPYILFFSQFI